MEWCLSLWALAMNALIFEVSVAASPNLALGKPATSSTFWDKNASFAVDGNTASGWGQGSCFQTNANDWNPWWQVDLGDQYRIITIVATSRSDSCCPDRLHDFSVEVYKDNPDLSTNLIPTICLYHLGNVAPGVPVMLNCSTHTIGRFVVLRGNATRNSDDRFTICELEIYGGLAPCTPCIKYLSEHGTRRNADLKATPSLANTTDRCAKECWTDFRCRSFNFNPGGLTPCEIILGGPSNKVSHPDWTYYHNTIC